MKIYESTTSNTFYIKSTKSSTGWFIWSEDDNEPKEYNNTIYKILPSPAWVAVEFDEIDLPDFCVEDCEYCHGKGYLSHDEDGIELCECHFSLYGEENAWKDYEHKKDIEEYYLD